ncbi:MAG: hypothetical protein ISS70_26215 [Phycisphaerae bacterium]|nr:hypothetical protein [Phycisphaerae bacterium]
MKALRPSKKWVLAAIGLLLALFILKIVLFLTAKPKITVDYVAEYNRTSRPQNYDPNENAAPYYQKAFDAFVSMPDKLHKSYINWPADFNDIEQALFEKWLISNTLAFEYFREASRKPYYWLARKSERDNTVAGIMLPELNSFRELTRALLWDAKIKALQGQFQPAFENILACYNAGQHKCHPSLLLTDQHNGLGIKKEAVDSALVILNSTNVENKALGFLQNALQSRLNNDDYIPSIQAEKYFLHDALQRTFIDNGKGTGKLAWRTGWYYRMLCGKWNNFERRLYACFIGPTRNEIVKQIEKILTISDQIMSKTPRQTKNEAYDCFEEIENINNSNWFLQILGVSPESTFHLYHKTRAQTKALIAVLAILRYKADTGQFPESLDKLVAAGYLQRLPNDPYSNEPLVYKLTEDSFELYSIGKDFTDDGGVIEVVNKARQEPGFRGTCIVPHVHSPDIVYWPVKELKKLCYEFTLEEAERLKAEKKAEAWKRLKEPNQSQ